MASVFLASLGHGVPGLTFLIGGSLQLVATSDHSCKRLKHGELYTMLLGTSFIFLYHYLPDAFYGGFSYKSLEHISMVLPFTVYTLLGIASSRPSPKPLLHLPKGYLSLTKAFAFAQELLLFHLHSSSHQGPEGHYHMLLQLAIAACLFFSIGEILYPDNSTTLKLGGAMSLMLQGSWFLQTALTDTFPSLLLLPGCSLSPQRMIRCTSDKLLADTLVRLTLLFSTQLTGIVISGTVLHVFVSGRCNSSYFALGMPIDNEL